MTIGQGGSLAQPGVPGDPPMTIMRPPPDQPVLARGDKIVAALRAIVPGEGVIDSPAEMLPYESDGLMAYRQPPMVVVLPDTAEQVSQVLKYCFEQGIKVVPRGSGTSLSGGALPLADGVLLGLGKFKRIREIDFDNRVVVTEAGVTNLALRPASIMPPIPRRRSPARSAATSRRTPAACIA